jgi:hypothetical protein
MKKIIIIAFYMLMITNMFGQTPDFCGISGEAEHRAYILSHSSVFNRGIGNPAPVDCSPRVFNVRFNVFNNDQGTNFCSRNGIPFGEEQFLDCIKILNMNFNRFNIFFKYRGYHFYGGSDGNGNLTHIEDVASSTDNIFVRQNQMTNLCEKDAININFVDQITTPYQPVPTITTNSNIGTEMQFTHQTLYAQAAHGRPIIIFNLPAFMGIPQYLNGQEFNVFKNFLLCHEMGHTFGLLHTFNTFYNTECEHVTRDPLNPNYNATTAGDMIKDTEAELGISNSDYDMNTCYFNQSSNPNPFYSDCQGTPFSLNLKYGNFLQACLTNLPYLNNNNNYGCLEVDQNDGNVLYRFTTNQGVFMREFINTAPGPNPTSPIGSTLSSTITNALTIVNSLFQPYSHDKILGAVLSTTDNGDGTAKVCRNYYSGNFKFQPGFDYTFPNNTSPDPLTATKYQTPVVVQPTYNCPVTIAQLANCGSNGSGHAYTVCRGVFCQNEPFTGGTITKTENLGSTYFSTETLDENQITDPNLINSLEGQMYHIIKKETTSGAELQQTIYKN